MQAHSRVTCDSSSHMNLAEKGQLSQLGLLDYPSQSLYALVPIASCISDASSSLVIWPCFDVRYVRPTRLFLRI